jgi:DNA-binding MarR family transcriptional regulator
MQENFDREPMILLHDIARTLRTRSDQLARAHGMTRAQWIILARLARQPGISQNEMANVCEVEPITVGRLIDRLEVRGLVERRADPKDRRVHRLHLLPPAEPILKEIAGYREALNEEVVAGLSEAERTKFVDLLVFIKSKLATGNALAAKLQMAGE